MKRNLALGLAVFVALFAIDSPVARADLFHFTQANTGIAGNGAVSAPYANVSITGAPATGVLTFTIDTAGNPARFTNFSFNLARGVSTSDFTFKLDSSTGGNAGSYGLRAGRNMSSFGRFDARVGPGNNAAGNRLGSITFEFDFVAGKFGEAVPANFEVKNKGGLFFALEYFPNSGNTGFVAADSPDGRPTNHFPEPASVILAAMGVACIGLFRWKVWRE